MCAGSPFDLALQAQVAAKKRRLHKPEALKRLEQGDEEFRRRKQAKALGKIINKEHKQYQTSFGMMLGIYTSVVNTTIGAEKLVLDDFFYVRKLLFPPAGSTSTPPHTLPQSFKFKDYGPKVFHHLRQRFAIDQHHYLNSLGGAYEYIEFNSNSKSGSFFFYSHDGKFMIKTQSKAESKFLRRILPHYYQYVMTHPHTYITRFYGMHRIKMPHLRKKVHFVVMQSVFYGDNDIHEMYDLKGSTVGRAATAKERERGPARCVYKDNDLTSTGTVIRLGPGRREAFIEQLRQDTDFLAAMGIMDYSLLLGIHFRSKRHSASPHALVHAATAGSPSSGAPGALAAPPPPPPADADAAAAAAGDGAAGPDASGSSHGRAGSSFPPPAGAAGAASGGSGLAAASAAGALGSSSASLGSDASSTGTALVHASGSGGGGWGDHGSSSLSVPPFSPAESEVSHATGAGGADAAAVAAGLLSPGQAATRIIARAATDAAVAATTSAVRASGGGGVGGGVGGGSFHGHYAGSFGSLAGGGGLRAVSERGGGVTGVVAADGSSSALASGGAGVPTTDGTGATGTGTAGVPMTPPEPDPRHGWGIPGYAPDGVTRADEVYYMGIIDILQQYDLRKMGETVIRSIYQPPGGISSVSPGFYARRFVEFMAANSR